MAQIMWEHSSYSINTAWIIILTIASLLVSGYVYMMRHVPPNTFYCTHRKSLATVTFIMN